MTGRTTSTNWSRLVAAVSIAVGLALVACGDPALERRYDAVPAATLPPVDDTVDDVVVGSAVAPVLVGAVTSAESPIPGVVTVAGWAHDDANDAPVEVTAELDGVPVGTVLAADEPVEGVPRTATGYEFDVVAAPGAHQVCITAADVTLGCVEVIVAGPAVDGIHLTEVRPRHDSDTVLVRGVIVGGDVPTTVAVTAEVGAVTEHLGVDVVDRLTVDARTFRFDLHDLPDGATYVCPVDATAIRLAGPALESARGGARGCATVVTTGALVAATTGRIDRITPIGPAEGHALHTTQRDAGIPVELSDGSVLMLWGDAYDLRSDGSLRYFVHNSASWASAAEPTVTHDAVDVSEDPLGRPHLFAEAPPGTCAGSENPKAALWPEAGVALRQPDGTDRVVVTMSKVCTVAGDFLDIDLVGYAIVEYTYDPNDPPIGRPIRGEVTQPHLAGEDDCFAKALAVGPDGYLYGQHCGIGIDDPDLHCEVARFDPDAVADPAARQVWDGGDPADDTSWDGDATSAGELSLQATCQFPEPIATLGLRYHDPIGLWTMTYSPWPGFVDHVAVRLAETPAGPFSAPLAFDLPACDGPVGGYGIDPHCYAGTAQLHRSDQPDEFGIGWYDMERDGGRGQYVSGIATVNVVRR